MRGFGNKGKMQNNRQDIQDSNYNNMQQVNGFNNQQPVVQYEIKIFGLSMSTNEKLVKDYVSEIELQNSGDNTQEGRARYITNKMVSMYNLHEGFVILVPEGALYVETLIRI